MSPRRYNFFHVANKLNRTRLRGKISCTAQQCRVGCAMPKLTVSPSWKEHLKRIAKIRTEKSAEASRVNGSKAALLPRKKLLERARKARETRMRNQAAKRKASVDK